MPASKPFLVVDDPTGQGDCLIADPEKSTLVSFVVAIVNTGRTPEILVLLRSSVP